MKPEFEKEFKGLSERLRDFEGRGRSSAVFLSKPVIEALGEGDVRSVVSQIEKAERRMEAEGRVLDFSSCRGIQEMARLTCGRLLEMGREGDVQELRRVFEKYFEVRESGIWRKSEPDAVNPNPRSGVECLEKALRRENIQEAVRCLAELEESGGSVDFSGCPGVEEAALCLYGRSCIDGDLMTVRAMQRAFGKYFKMPDPKP
jgi:hypothetical protein